jgi:MarR family transcriptional regulator, lower aerobic nicotinate degradation pathway regulator
MPRTSIKPAPKIAVVAAETDYRLDDQVGFQLRRAYQRASANLATRLAAYDLTVPQFSVLARLHERGRVSQNLLGRLVVMEPANIRDVVLRLKKRGLIRSQKESSDKRLILLSLTREGSSLFETLRVLQAESTVETLAPLRQAERTLLLNLLHRVGDG